MKKLITIIVFVLLTGTQTFSDSLTGKFIVNPYTSQLDYYVPQLFASGTTLYSYTSGTAVYSDTSGTAVYSGTSGTAGVPFSGTNSDAVQSQSKVQDQNRVIEKDRVHRMIQQENKNECLLESRVTGIEMFDFVHEGSISGALATGAKSVLQYIWNNQGGVGANSIVTVAHEAIRSLK